MSPEQARGQVRGQAGGHLGLRRRALRDAVGAQGVRRRDGLGHARRGAARRRRLGGAAAARRRPRCAACCAAASTATRRRAFTTSPTRASRWTRRPKRRRRPLARPRHASRSRLWPAGGRASCSWSPPSAGGGRSLRHRRRPRRRGSLVVLPAGDQLPYDDNPASGAVPRRPAARLRRRARRARPGSSCEPLDAAEAQAVEGTADAVGPFFSPGRALDRILRRWQAEEGRGRRRSADRPRRRSQRRAAASGSTTTRSSSAPSTRRDSCASPPGAERSRC